MNYSPQLTTAHSPTAGSMLMISTMLWLTTAPLPAAAAPSKERIHRIALVAGANNGGRDRVLLRYAQSDAKAMSRVLQELGGLAPGDVRLLLEPSRALLRTELLKLRFSYPLDPGEWSRHSLPTSSNPSAPP